MIRSGKEGLVHGRELAVVDELLEHHAIGDLGKVQGVLPAQRSENDSLSRRLRVDVELCNAQG